MQNYGTSAVGAVRDRKKVRGKERNRKSWIILSGLKRLKRYSMNLKIYLYEPSLYHDCGQCHWGQGQAEKKLVTLLL
jgi:hypothetical protein